MLFSLYPGTCSVVHVMATSDELYYRNCRLMPFYGAAEFTRRPEVAIIHVCVETIKRGTVMSHDLPGYSVPPPAVHCTGKCKVWSSLVESLIGNFLWDVPMH